MPTHAKGTPGGHRMRTLRERVGKTQLDVELDAMLGSGYLQRVESGKVAQPERDTLERILTALSARYTDRREVLEMFGYWVDAPRPTDADIRWAIGVCQAELNSAMFPAYLLDCAHRLLVWNNMFPKLFRIKSPLHNDERVSMMRVLFDPAYGVTPMIANPDIFFPASIRALRSEIQLFSGEAWYEALITDMRTVSTFEKYWQQANGISGYHIAGRPLTPLTVKLPEVGLVNFRIMAEPFIQDRRFRIIYCLPADIPTMQVTVAWVDK
jgi:transcriptional regulator with XRE-family HTH domain